MGVTAQCLFFNVQLKMYLKVSQDACVRTDNILVTRETDKIHLENLYRVLQKLVQKINRTYTVLAVYIVSKWTLEKRLP